MKGLLELRKQWGKTVDDIAALAERVKQEERLFSDEEKERLAELEAEEKRLSAEIERLESEERAQTERLLEVERLKERRGKMPEARPGVAITVTREEGLNDKGEVCVFRSFGEQLQAAAEVGRNPHVRNSKVELCQKLMRAATGLSEGVAQDGGFLVQADFSSEILRKAYDTGLLASRVRKIPIGSNSLKMNAIDDPSRANGSRWGGIQAFWEDEADTITASKPKFRQMSWVTKKLTGAFYATEEVLEDASALGALATEGFAEEFGFKLDDAIFRGTGAGQPQGIMNSGALVTVAAEGGQTAATIVLNNIVKMRARLWARSRLNSTWFNNQDTEPQLNILSLTVGNNSYPVLLPATGISGAPYDTMYGRPVVPIEQCETLGTKGDIVLFDLTQYLMVDRGSMRSAQSVHVRFLQDEQVFKFAYRCDGQPLWDKPITSFKGANTLSPFVALANR